MKEEPDPWTLPVDRMPSDHPSLVLADKIAATIKKWLAEGRMIQSLGHPVTPGDILILVRSRNRFFDAVIRQLQVEGIKVAGADRVKLGEHIAVADLIALGEFVLLPEDDHALACLLKSPLIRHPEERNFDDEDLFALAHARGGKSLWQCFAKRRPWTPFSKLFSVGCRSPAPSRLTSSSQAYWPRAGRAPSARPCPPRP